MSLKRTITKIAILTLLVFLPQIGISNAVFSDTETSVGNTFSAGVWNSSVRVCKYDTQENPVEGQRVFLKGKYVETVEVSSDGSFSSSSNLNAGNYLLLTSGTYEYWPAQLPDAGIADTGYSLRPEGSDNPGPGPQWISGDDLGSPWTGFLEVKVNGLNVDWGYFSPSHIYSHGLYHGGGQMNFNIVDSHYNDNSGSITVDIYKGWSGTTGQDGCVTFDGVWYGEYELDEILGEDWEYVSGDRGDIVVDESEELFNLVNSHEVCEEGQTWADEHVDSLQGTKKSGAAITDSARTDPEAVVGEPDGNFYSIGKNGWIITSFKYPVLDGDGVDLSFHEVTWGNRFSYPEERAAVEVSMDGTYWLPIGEVSSHVAGGIAYLDFSSTGFSWIKYVRLTDSSNFGPHGNSADGYDIDAIDALYGVCEDQEVACSTISGYKYDVSENGLAGWEIVVHNKAQSPVDSLVLDASDYTQKFTNISLASGRKYLVEVEGFWYNKNGDRAVDADYWSDNGWSTVEDFDEDAGRGNRQLDVVINEEDVDWGSYNSAHLYKTVIHGNGSQASLRIYDEDQDSSPPSWYEDNSGTLAVRIYDVTDEIVFTNQEGYYEKLVCEGNYQVLEVSQPGWRQAGTPSYYDIDVPGGVQNPYNFTNEPYENNILGDNIEESEYAGQVVINEVMWMGSPFSDEDEWIELRNMTGSSVDLTGWVIENAGSTIGLSGSIPANGYFLLANFAETSSAISDSIAVDQVDSGISLSDSQNGHLILKDSIGAVVDRVKGDSWPAGENGSDKKSMERNSTPGDGLDASSWHTCEDPVCNDSTYWDTHDGNNYGTPKAANHSENDPSVKDKSQVSEKEESPSDSEETQESDEDVQEEKAEEEVLDSENQDIPAENEGDDSKEETQDESYVEEKEEGEEEEEQQEEEEVLLEENDQDTGEDVQKEEIIIEEKEDEQV